MQFVSTLNPNEINPGASFVSAYEGGANRAIEQQRLAQQKQLTMAQLAQNQQQFSVTSELEKQKIAQQGVLNMAQIGMMGEQSDLYKTQVDAATTLHKNLLSDQGTMADDFVKMHSMSASGLPDYQGGNYLTQEGRANFESAKGQLLGTAQGQQALALRNANIAAQTQLTTNQLDNVNYAKQFNIPVPTQPDGTIDQGTLNNLVVQDQNARATAKLKATSEVSPEVISTEKRMQGLNTMAQIKATTGMTNNVNTVSGRQYAAELNSIAKREAEGLITDIQAEQEIAEARQRRDASSGVVQPQQQGSNMQNPSGSTPVPATASPGSAAWLQNISGK